MDQSDFVRCKALNNIPQKKLLEYLSSIENGDDDPQTKNIKLIAINRYAESNIPILYWNLKMEKDFCGDPRLLTKYNEYISDIKSSYDNGKSICFAGLYGCGKTFVSTCILKKICAKGYSGLYTTATDVVNILVQATGEDKYLSKKELTMVDFLVLDELDPRFYSNENAADLYARSLEGVFRTRCQNKLPTIICTNSPNIVESLNGSLKASIDSLMNGYMEIFPIFGEDFRKKNK